MLACSGLIPGNKGDPHNANCSYNFAQRQRRVIHQPYEENIAGFLAFETNLLGLAGETELGLLLLVLHAGCVAACCKCCSILGSSVGSFALHSIYYVCVYLYVAGYFHCQIYFKWVQLSAQRFLFAFRICFSPPFLCSPPSFRFVPKCCVHCEYFIRTPSAVKAAQLRIHLQYSYTCSYRYRYICSCSLSSMDTVSDTDTDTVAHTCRDAAEISGGGPKQTPSVVLATFAVCRVCEGVY